MANWYCGSTKWTAVTAWAASTSYSIGDLRRQLATPTKGNERVFRCTTAGTSGSSEPSWTLTKGGTTNDNTVVWTEVTGNSTYNEGATPWGAPHASILTAATWMAAGDRLWVSNNHAYAWAADKTITFPGTPASPNQILCGADTAAPPTALATTASETCGGTAIAILGLSGCAYIYGVTFQGGSTYSGISVTHLNTDQFLCAEQCTFNIKENGYRFDLGTAYQCKSSRIVLKNCVVHFNNAGCYVSPNGGFIDWQGGSVAGTAPTTLFSNFGGYYHTQMILNGVDLSLLGTGKTIVSLAGLKPALLRFVNCKLGVGVTLTSGTPTGQGGMEAEFINCDSADTNYNYQGCRYQGNIYDETTIVRTGGASDGTTAYSRKMVSSASSRFTSPLVLHTIPVWNEAIGSEVTATVEGIVNAAAIPTDAEWWLEIEYMGTSGLPLSLFLSDRAADILATPANQAASTAAWDSKATARANSTAYAVGDVFKVASNPGRLFFCTVAGTTASSEPGGYATAVDGDSVVDNTATFRAAFRFKGSVAFTPQEKGWIRGHVMLAKASTTVYACPKMDVSGITSSRQYMLDCGVVNQVDYGTGGVKSVGVPIGIF